MKVGGGGLVKGGGASSKPLSTQYILAIRARTQTHNKERRVENAYNRHIFNASFPANLTSAPRDANAAPLCRPPCQLPAVPFLEKGSEGCWELIASQKLLARRVPRGLELLAVCQARPTSSDLIKASYGFQAFFLPPPPFSICALQLSCTPNGAR